MDEHDVPEEAVPDHDFGTWSESNRSRQESVSDGKLNRREFLKAAMATTAALATSRFPKPLVPSPENSKQKTDTEGGPSVEATDILTSEELETRYNTRIHDLSRDTFPNDYVELGLRKSVGDERLFQRLESGRMAGLDIFLINGPDVDPQNLTVEQRAYLEENHPTIIPSIERQMQAVVEFNRKEIEVNRKLARQEYFTRLEDLNNRASNISNDKYVVEKQALDYKYGRYLADEPNSDDLSAIKMRGYAPTLGGG